MLKYEIEAGERKALVYKAEYGWNIFGYYRGLIHVGWYAPTLKQARKLADALVAE